MIVKHFDVDPLPGYHPEYGLMLAIMQDGTREWRDELGEIEPEGIVWQAYPGGYSIGGVMLHIAEVEVYWIEEFCLGRKLSQEDEKLFMSKEIEQYEGKWPTSPKEPLAYYFRILDDVRARTLEAYKQMGDPKEIKPRRDEEYTLAWVLAHVVEHESYHGGQIVMLKELCKRR